MASSGNHETVVEQWWAVVRRLCPDLEVEQPADGEAASGAVPGNVQRRAWAEVLEIPYWEDLRSRTPSMEFVERVPIGFVRQHTLMAFLRDTAGSDHDDQVVVAIGSLDAWPLLDVVGRHLKRVVQPVFAPEDQILTAINQAYQQRNDQSSSLVEVLDEKEGSDEVQSLVGREDLLDSGGRPPIIKLVNSILTEAVKARASDVHVQPQEESVVVRQRIDGVLFDVLDGADGRGG